MPRKTKAEQFASVPFQEVTKMSTDALRKQAKRLRTAFNRRVKSIERAGKFSYAAEQYRPKAETARDINRMTRNQLLSELANMQSFFQAESSTIRGINRLEREQDARIFGKTPSGRPRRRMSNTEREKFWSLYSEYENMYHDTNTRYPSESVQQMIAEEMLEFMGEDFVELLDRVRQKLSKEQDNFNGQFGSDISGVYSGRGNPFQR